MGIGMQFRKEKKRKTKQNKTKKKALKPSVVAHAFNSSTQEEEAGRYVGPGWSAKLNAFLL